MNHCDIHIQTCTKNAAVYISGHKINIDGNEENIKNYMNHCTIQIQTCINESNGGQKINIDGNGKMLN